MQKYERVKQYLREGKSYRQIQDAIQKEFGSSVGTRKIKLLKAECTQPSAPNRVHPVSASTKQTLEQITHKEDEIESLFAQTEVRSSAPNRVHPVSASTISQHDITAFVLWMEKLDPKLYPLQAAQIIQLKKYNKHNTIEDILQLFSLYLEENSHAHH